MMTTEGNTENSTLHTGEYKIGDIVDESCCMIDAATETIRAFIFKGPLIKASFPQFLRPDASIEDKRLARDMLAALFEMAPLLWNAIYTLEYSRKELARASDLCLKERSKALR